MEPIDEEEEDKEPRHCNLDVGNWIDPDWPGVPGEAERLLARLYELTKSDPRGPEAARLLARYRELTGKDPAFVAELL